MIRNLLKTISLILCAVSAMPYHASAQFSIAAGATNYTQDFNTLTNGTWTNGTTLTGWYVKTDATASITAYGANSGTNTTAGLYAFGVAGTNALTDRALGFATSNSFTGTAGSGKNYMGWRLKNNTGNTITSVTVTWTGEQWRKETSPAQSLSLSYQTGTTVTDLTAGTWTSASSTFTSLQNNAASAGAIDGNATANRTASISVTITVSIAPGDEIMLRWEDLNDSGNDHMLAIDDITVNAAATAGCTAPGTQATAVSTSNITASGMDASWTAGNGTGGTMIVVRPTAQANTLPVSGTAYTANTAWASAGQIDANNRVVFRAAGNSVTGITGLTAETQYTVSAYEYSATDCYNTTSAPTASFYTFSTEPAAHAASFSASAAAYNQINLSFSAASTISNADGYIILQKIGSAPTGLPADGQSYTVGNTIGDATVAAIVNSTSAVSQSINSLTGSTDYYYTLIPFNWNSSVTATYNYNTTATIPGSHALTPMPPGVTSDIVDNAGGGFYTTNIDYTQWQSASITSIGTGAGTGLGVFSMLLRDGGAAADADAMPTTLTALTVGYAGTANTVRSAALFDGATKVADGVVSASSISFSGLSVSVADDNTKALTLAVTFNTTVADNDKLVFTVSSATAASNTVSSQFAAANAGAAASENNSGNDNNRIEVTATKLLFTTQPSSAEANNAMSPAPVVKATDANNNADADYTGSVTLTSTGTMTGNPATVSAAAGVATFSGLVHTVTGTGYNFTASASGFSNVTSNNFDVTTIPYADGDYRTTGGGTWPTSGTATWEKRTSGVWSSSSAPSASYSAGRLYILHTVTSSGAFASPSFAILSGGKFTVTNTSTIADMHVYTGGTFEVGGSITFSASASKNFVVDSGATLTLNSSALDNTKAFWSGNEDFKSGSVTEIKDWSYSSSSGAQRFLATTPQVSANSNGNGYLFGNIIYSGSQTSLFGFVNGSPTVKLCENNLTINNPLSSPNVTFTNAGASVEIGGNMVINSNTFSFSVSSSGTPVSIIHGNLFVNGTATANINQQSSSSNTSINLYGNLQVASGATLMATNSNTNEVVFKNAGTQSIEIDGTLGNNVSFKADNGSELVLPQNLVLTNASNAINVLSGGTLNFNGFNVTGSGSFTLSSGGALKITSAAGITSSGATGNVQTTTRSFNAGGIYQYTGSAGQVSGNGVPATVANLVINNASGATLSQPTTVSTALTLTNGIINTTATNTLTINAGAAITGGSNSSFVNGPLTVKTSSTLRVALPVGKGTAYGPAAITPESNVASTYTAEYFNGANATPDYSNFGTSNLVKVDTFQYWNIARTAGTADVRVTLSWVPASNVTFGGDLSVAHYNGTAWENVGRTATTGSLSAGTITSAPVSNFSPFTVGFMQITPLAVKLSSFDAARKQGSVALNWVTAEEQGSDRFELERSENGKDYTMLATVKANGHAATYDYTDAKPAQGKNYYRLAMIDNTGKKQYSSVRVVDMGNDKSFAVVAFPNPVSDRLTVQAANKTAAATVQLTDLTGKLLQQVQMTGNAAELDMTGVAPGVYLVRYADGTHTELFKIVK